ncbi:MRG and Tudor-knot domain containing protein [Trichuris trichiura]|uniref:MRG and Tudor-knot domain containing protein n=1 Tax=Trichuris trichiura TaxID=36087 RepID=A0A077Z1K2_TRITR|nr:MRG and Tudor-knot domain containing protein [Trichuris trichiura]
MQNEHGGSGKSSHNNKTNEASKHPKSSPHVRRRSSVVEEAGEDQPVFPVGSSVTCKYLDGKLYPCRVINVRKSDKGCYEYRVHYRDWNKRYDEWVVASKLLPEEVPPKRPKRVREVQEVTVVDLDEETEKFPTFHDAAPFVLSEALMTILENDKNQMKSCLVQLPAKMSIDSIFEMYAKAQAQNEERYGEKEAMLFCQQMRKLFNSYLAGWLLYEVESAQHTELCAKFPDKQQCDLYGFIHLLRLLHTMKHFLRYLMVADEVMSEVVAMLYEFNRFLEARVDEFKETVTYDPL